MTQQLISYTYSSIFLQVGKKSHCKKAGLENSEDIHCQSSIFKMTNGIRKVRLGVDIFNKRTLDFSKFISDTVLQNTALSTTIFSLQPAEYKLVSIMHNAQPIRILFSMFPFSLFLARGKGKRSIEKPLLLCTIIFFFFPSRMYCHVIFHTGFCSAARNWRELYKNLSVLSFLDAYT